MMVHMRGKIVGGKKRSILSEFFFTKNYCVTIRIEQKQMRTDSIDYVMFHWRGSESDRNVSEIKIEPKFNILLLKNGYFEVKRLYPNTAMFLK